jgi:EmrB/QacA subfamily drug resistance transporter
MSSQRPHTMPPDQEVEAAMSSVIRRLSRPDSSPPAGGGPGGARNHDVGSVPPGTLSTPAPGSMVSLRSTSGAALIATTVLASAVGFFNASVVYVAIPAIGRDLNASVATLQWMLTGYLVTVAALLLVAGALADRFGRKRVLTFGLTVMLAASVLCAVAPSAGVLVAARVVQGVGGALVIPSSLALLNGTLTVPDRARGIGLWAGLATISSTVGPYVGGWLVDAASWRWMFLLNVPLIVGALLPLSRVPENQGRVSRLSLDVTGAALAILGLGGVIYAATDGTAHGWLTARVLVAAALGLGCLAALVPVERRVPAPMLRLSLFRSRQFSAINVTTVLFYGAMAGASYLVVLQCELQLGYSAAQAGAALIPYSVVFLLMSPISGALVARVGPRWLMASGIAVVALGLVWMSQARPGSSYLGTILPAALVWGLGVGLAVTPLTAAVLAAVADTDLGEAAAVNDAASRIGGVVAVAAVPVLIGAVGGLSLDDAVGHGYQTAMLVTAGVCVAAAVIAGLFVSDDRAGAPRLAPPPPQGCAPPTPVPAGSVPARHVIGSESS